MTDATTRFKALLANALERVCVLEAELEQAQEKVRELEASQNGKVEVTEHDGSQLDEHDRSHGQHR